MGFNFLYTDRWAFNLDGGGGTYVCAVRVEGGGDGL